MTQVVGVGIQRVHIVLITSRVRIAALEPKGVLYTKRWVLELLLDLAGYKPEANLVDAVAVGPAAGNAQAASATPRAAAIPDATAILWRRHHGNDKSTS